MSIPTNIPQILDGEIAIVTGAGQGIGRALALGLARAGAQIAVCDIDQSTLAETANMLRADGCDPFAECVDVSDPAACDRFLAIITKRFGDVSVLVNNAAVLRTAPVGAGGFAASWRESFRINLDGTMNMIVASLLQLQRTRGRIVNISSTSAFLAAAGGAAYSASKGAVSQLTRALAVEFGACGVRINAIAPGVTETPLAQAAIGAAQGDYVVRIPLGRIASPDDMVGPVLFLASALSSHVTGAILPVDGGYLATGVTRAARG